jgi:hypothetical protein
MSEQRRVMTLTSRVVSQSWGYSELPSANATNEGKRMKFIFRACLRL